MAATTDGVKRSPEEVEREIGSMRDGLSTVLDELRYRRERAMRLGTNMKRHAPKMARGMALFGGIAAAVRFLRKRREKRHATA